MSRGAGFTIIEVLIGISIFALLGSIAIPQGFMLLRSQQFESAIITVTAHARKAWSYAALQYVDQASGIKLFPTYGIIFSGSSYDTRDNTKDQRFTLPLFSRIEFDHSEFIFSKATGTVNPSSTIRIIAGPLEKVISINSYGRIATH